jgi:putative glutamine amidotransferase
MFSGRNKPKIGVTGPDRGGYPAWFFTRIAVWRAGGKAIRIRPGKKVDPETLDGLIIGGGADIDPGRYGDTIDDIAEHREKGTEDEKEGGGIIAWLMAPVIMLIRRLFSLGSIPVDPERDELEQEFMENAVRRNLPVLGICRGAQFMNVFWGGNLHQAIIDFYTEEPKIESVYPRKRINVVKGTHLEGILQKESCLINSLHNQAVDLPGPEILVAATDLAGVVQAVEHKTYPFALGVQWHPEYLPQVKSQQGIFRKLVRLAASQNENEQE